jgi:hypothetical protein
MDSFQALAPYMECFNDTFHFYPDDEYLAYKRECEIRRQNEDHGRIYRVSYPEHFYVPTSPYEKGADGVVWNPVRYTPYKRISHFREHINRLQYCQTVTIPQHVMDSVSQFFKTQTIETHQQYTLVKQHLRKHNWSHLNEHIHYLISANTRSFINIVYEDHRKMCTLFTQLEHQFKQAQQKQTHDRKNIFSYYLIVQLVLYLFHYHPTYSLPTLFDLSKRKVYYRYLLTLLQKVPMSEDILFMHFKRKRDCQQCNQGLYFFDDDLITLL